MNSIPPGYAKNTDPDATVREDWFYSYDGGGITGVIPDYAPVNPEWVGKAASKTGTAWEYFYMPVYVGPTPIPVDSLKALAIAHSCDIAVLFAYNESSQMSHVVTWGGTDELSASAAKLGNQMKSGLGWPDHLHADPPIVATLKAKIAALEASSSDIVGYQNECEGDQDAEYVAAQQALCPHSHEMKDLDPEDGCVHCGFYAR